MPGCVVLIDGSCFKGTRFGSRDPVVGEIALYTGVVGWQEVLTDPAYAGKIVVFTYPHVGNYGVNDEDMESSEITVKGIVVRDLARFYSNFRAQCDFRSWVEAKGIAGLAGVDTRAIMVHTRDHGGGIAAIAANEPEARKAMRESGSPFDRNLVSEVQGFCRPPETWGEAVAALGTQHIRLAVLDLGGKYSLYRQFAELGCSLQIFPWDTSAETILASGASGLLLPPGPGDPNRLGTVVNQVNRLLGKLPILGIGLGFQLLALALGAVVTRLKAGRHGVNYPIRSTRGEPSLIAACHHSFAVAAEPLPAGVTVTYTHINEGTPMGIEALGLNAWGYQFHPGRDIDNRPSPLLAQFVESCLTPTSIEDEDHA
ncbi:MAG: carbamoyl phosphate synthase small subunit [Chloroflexota bacterium]